MWPACNCITTPLTRVHLSCKKILPGSMETNILNQPCTQVPRLPNHWPRFLFCCHISLPGSPDRYIWRGIVLLPTKNLYLRLYHVRCHLSHIAGSWWWYSVYRNCAHRIAKRSPYHGCRLGPSSSVFVMFHLLLCRVRLSCPCS
jgi:hypothetical protein